jgi:L-ascorbate metabolism protein UlaG (beta-lactamase superfamily)
MVPIDGQWTLTYDQIALTIAQLKPAVVLPMHYDFARHARLFADFIRQTVPVRLQAESMLRLTRGTLPASSEVIVLGYRE